MMDRHHRADELCAALVLQGAFQKWKEEQCKLQMARVFSEAVEKRRLRDVVKHLHRVAEHAVNDREQRLSSAVDQREFQAPGPLPEGSPPASFPLHTACSSFQQVILDVVERKGHRGLHISLMSVEHMKGEKTELNDWSKYAHEQELPLQTSSSLCRLKPGVFVAWESWVQRDRERRALAAQTSGLRCCRLHFARWRVCLAQHLEAEKRIADRCVQRIRQTLLRWHSLTHPERDTRMAFMLWKEHCDRKQAHSQQRSERIRSLVERAALHWRRIMLLNHADTHYRGRLSQHTFLRWRQALACQQEKHRQAWIVGRKWLQLTQEGRAREQEANTFSGLAQRHSLTRWFRSWVSAYQLSVKGRGVYTQSQCKRTTAELWAVATVIGVEALIDTDFTILGETHDEDDEILPRKDYESLDYDKCINEPYVEVLEGMDNKPIAAGSGIPEIKSYLNGVKIPGIVRFRTFVCKAVGVLFSVAGGLFVGKEGPMIHCGSIIGAGLPQFQSITFKKIRFNFPYFRSDRDKRDFVSAGAAAGVAAAFGAPIGGTLFSLEEGSSFWNQALTWKVLFCSMSATFTLNFFRSGILFNSWGTFQLPGLLNFGEFKCSDGNKKCHLWTAVDLAFFVVMGIGGGLLGALFNCMNKRLAKYRMRNVHPKAKFVRLLESLLVSMVTTIVIFVASMTLGKCQNLSSPTTDNTTLLLQSPASEDGNSTIKQFFCRNKTYNDMAALFFNPQEVAIHQLFHQDGTFSPETLTIFFVLYFVLACWTYGVSVPSGLFVPSLLCGAAYGRLVANILKTNIGLDIYAGTFALIGAASFLGGVVRMTISLTVILIESTNEISYGLPIMITLMVAKWTGDFFNKGIYDIYIVLKGAPLLEWETEVEMDKLTASDIMEPNLTYVYPHTRIQSLVSILRTTVYHAFPVVTENRGNETEFMKGNILISNNIRFKKSSILTRAGEQRRRSQSMKSYPSSELRNVCDDQVSAEPADEGQDMLQQMLERRHVPYPNLYPDQSPSEEWTMEERFRPLTFHGLILRSQLVTLLIRGVCYAENQSSATQPRLSFSEMTEDYPRYPDIHDLDLLLLNPRMIVIVGIITRHNLTQEFLLAKLRQHYITM
ncbi:CLCN6 protein, partial [Atractosteus spatula]|nr:CLCN6 protein [Atractosteus spatula]